MQALCGHFPWQGPPSELLSTIQVSDILTGEIRDGIGGSGGVRCGFIGEMGCSYPLTTLEEKCLRAAAIAQQNTGMFST